MRAPTPNVIVIGLSLGILACLLPGHLDADEVPTLSIAVDYFPSFVYQDEDAGIHLRVPDGRPGESDLSLHIIARDDHGKTTGTYSSHTPFPEFQFVIPGSVLTRSSVLLVQREGATTSLATFVVARAWQELPLMHTKQGLLESAEHRKVIVVVKHVKEASRRKWLFIRKIMEWVKGPQPPSHLVLLTDLAADVPESPTARFMGCADGDLNASLNALAVLSGKPSLDGKAAFLVMLGTGDIRSGIDPVTYRRGLEAVIQQLRCQGVQRVRLATPISSPFHGGRRAQFEKVITNTSYRFQLESPVNSSKYISRTTWQADPDTGVTYATLPRNVTKALVSNLLGAWQ